MHMVVLMCPTTHTHSQTLLVHLYLMIIKKKSHVTVTRVPVSVKACVKWRNKNTLIRHNRFLKP